MMLTKKLDDNLQTLHTMLPLNRSFDFIRREITVSTLPALFLGLNGLCDTDLLEKILSDLQSSISDDHAGIDDLQTFIKAHLSYVQVSTCRDFDTLVQALLSGPSVFLIDGFDTAVLVDVRRYPDRGVEEPDAERISRGAKDGFVETLLTNTNLIRRHVHSPQLVFELQKLGSESRTDIAITYMDGLVNKNLLSYLRKTLAELDVSSLTMGSKTLEELLVRKKWFHPLPNLQLTERPDVACSYLCEGHILVLVDNSPVALILPCTMFQFTQSPEDYYKSPIVGTLNRLVRFACILVTTLLLPLFLLLAGYMKPSSPEFQLLTTGDMGPMRLFFYVLMAEFFLNLFKNSASLSGSMYSGSLSIVGGILIGDMAVELNWVSTEVLFYAALTLLASLSLPSREFSDALGVYRAFLIVCTGLGGPWGFGIGCALVLLSILTTPTFGGMSYFWPLCPFQPKALLRLLFRSPTVEAQPEDVWNRGKVKE